MSTMRLRLFFPALVLVALAGAAFLRADTPLLRISMQAELEEYAPLLTEIYASIGYKVQFVILPSERALSEADTGTVDGEMGRVRGGVSGYSNLVQTKESLLTVCLQAWTRRGSTLKIPEAGALKNLKLGSLLGQKMSGKFLSDNHLSSNEVTTVDQLAQMVAAGRVDVALLVTVNNVSAIQQTGQISNANLAMSETFHVLNISHAGLVPLFDAALRKMKLDGRYEKLLPRR